MCSLAHNSSFGVRLVTRKMGNSLSPTVEVTLEGDTYTLTTTSTFKTSAISFKLGVEFDEETLDGRNVKSIITLDGNKLTQEQKGDKPTTIVREFTDNELITTLTIGSVKCVRVYKAV
ncbi:GD20655 [Drosophila simulans]|uniref:Fatty acid-binding protein, muscle n=1 Tax=Drosophila simulans TaxID=7240 RepID=B4QU25_DROSI|nr:GD20655 [Drosophila simulans]